ncbi:hypothetical protein [Reyranella sp.]|uniref:hypothetical protein n=1 Tax=Reyranella sp. TaxID=1929291 RepID=UPI003D0B7FBB
MTLAAIAYFLFTFFNSVRVVSYLPQIHRVARDTQGASCISYLTWMMWSAANASTSLYAFVGVGDIMLGLVNLLNTVCCLTVIGLATFKRHQFRRSCERWPKVDPCLSAPQMPNLKLEVGPSRRSL